jgi:hypothetical protein
MASLILGALGCCASKTDKTYASEKPPVTGKSRVNNSKPGSNGKQSNSQSQTGTEKSISPKQAAAEAAHNRQLEADAKVKASAEKLQALKKMSKAEKGLA